MKPALATAIWWIRRDLRLTDNAALHAALAHAGPEGNVLPLFILDPALLNSEWVGEKRIAFLYEGLRALADTLRTCGSRLVVRSGAPADVLTRLAREIGASAICAERDHSPYAIRRDDALAELLPLELVDGVTLRPPGAIRKADGTPYTVFTPYSKAWKAACPPSRSDILPAPAHLHTPIEPASEALPVAPGKRAGTHFPASEAEAIRRLGAFVNGDAAPIYDYANTRNRPDVDGTAQLSPYMRFGMLSPRMAALAAYTAMSRAPSADAARSAESWLNELIWREFYVQILDAFPHVRSGAFRPVYNEIDWLDDEQAFAAWCDGRTGYPIVDAAMRQLRATGWIHNRLRMIVASFLVKDLLIDWRQGERWFMQQLIDGDPAANNGGWQWTAGVGTDAAPYFRIFNPVSQGKKFDPQGDYVRRWLPELAQLPGAAIHDPWTLGDDAQTRLGCRIGVDYPAPIVDHAFARVRVLDTFAALRVAT